MGADTEMPEKFHGSEDKLLGLGHAECPSMSLEPRVARMKSEGALIVIK